MNLGNVTRRGLLRRGGAALGVGMVGGTAGCSDGLLGSGSDLPGFSRWVPTHGMDPSNPVNLGFRGLNYESLRAIDDQLPQYGFIAQLEQRRAALAVEPETVSAITIYFPDDSARAIITGNFDKQQIMDRVQQNQRSDRGPSFYKPDFDFGGEYRNFAILHHERRDMADQQLAISESAVVEAAGDVETIIDAKNGEADRYFDVQTDMKTLLETIGDCAYFNAEPAQPSTRDVFPGVKARGWGIRNVEESTSNRQISYVFDSPERMSTGEFREKYTSTFNMSSIGDYGVEKSGRVLTIEWTIDTKKAFGIQEGEDSG